MNYNDIEDDYYNEDGDPDKFSDFFDDETDLQKGFCPVRNCPMWDDCLSKYDPSGECPIDPAVQWEGF